MSRTEHEKDGSGHDHACFLGIGGPASMGFMGELVCFLIPFLRQRLVCSCPHLHRVNVCSNMEHKNSGLDLPRNL